MNSLIQTCFISGGKKSESAGSTGGELQFSLFLLTIEGRVRGFVMFFKENATFFFYLCQVPRLKKEFTPSMFFPGNQHCRISQFQESTAKYQDVDNIPENVGNIPANEDDGDNYVIRI